MATTKASEAKSPAIGIDLGTGVTVPSFWRNGKVEVIPNNLGSRLNPSWVAFSDSEGILVGEPAKNQAAANPKNTLYCIKRLIGRRFSEKEVQEDIKNWPFRVVDDGKDRPVIEVEYKGEIKRFRPEEISAMILSKMKEFAEEYIGMPIKNCIITVPAYFNDSQRSATRDAGLIANLNVLRIINEPTAAAIAYGFDKKDGKERTILVIDIGSGTSDHTLLQAQDGILEIKSTGGNNHAGGSDIDVRLRNHFANEFKTKYRKDLTTNPRAMSRLLIACERAKHTLSTSLSATIEIDSLFEGTDFKSSITRARFESLCQDLFDTMLKPIDQVLADGKISKSQVDEVVLVGGTTRIPRIVDMVRNYFGGKEPCKSCHPDEAISIGSAILCAQLNNDAKDNKEISDLLILDVCPLSLGVETNGTTMTNIIDRGTTVPCRKSKVFSTAMDDQQKVQIAIYEGERPFTKDNNKLAVFELGPIPPAPRGVPQIEINFDLDVSGILKVSAEEKKSGNKNEIKVTNDANRLSKEDIEKFVKEAELYKAEDKAKKEKVEFKNRLENLVYTARSKLSSGELKLSPDQQSKVEKKIAEFQHWLDTSEHAEKSEFEAKEREFQEAVMPLIYSAASGTSGPIPGNFSADSSASSGGVKIDDLD